MRRPDPPTMRDAIRAALTAASIPVGDGNRPRGVVVADHGEACCRLTFRPAKPTRHPVGVPWDADAAARLLAVAVLAALPVRSYRVETSGQGTSTVLLVTAVKKAEVAA